MKKPSESMSQYVKRIKELKDLLANVYVIVDDENLIIYALKGMTDYNTFHTSMRMRSQPITFEELHVLLVFEEIELEKQVKYDEAFAFPTALLVSTLNSSRNQIINPNMCKVMVSLARIKDLPRIILLILDFLVM